MKTCMLSVASRAELMHNSLNIYESEKCFKEKLWTELKRTRYNQYTSSVSFMGVVIIKRLKYL
jgi:hypothetical protein